MKTLNLFLLVFFISFNLHAEQLRLTLLEDHHLPIKDDTGNEIGQIEIKKGATLLVLKTGKTKLLVQRGKSRFVILKSKTNYDEVMETRELVKKNLEKKKEEGTEGSEENPSGPQVNAPKKKPSGKATAGLKSRIGSRLYTKDKKSVSINDLSDKKRIGLYFSAAWCGPCKAYTPKLIKAYDAIRNAGYDFEIVFVSLDNNSNSMFDYMKKMKMPWLAMRHSMGDANKMMKEFGSSGIPTLIIIDEEGKMVLDEAGKPIGNARQDIFKGPNAAWKRWTK